MLVDYWAHRHFDDPKLADEIVSDDFEADVEAMLAGRPMIPASADPGDWEEVASGLPAGISL